MQNCWIESASHPSSDLVPPNCPRHDLANPRTPLIHRPRSRQRRTWWTESPPHFGSRKSNWGPECRMWRIHHAVDPPKQQLTCRPRLQQKHSRWLESLAHWQEMLELRDCFHHDFELPKLQQIRLLLKQRMHTWGWATHSKKNRCCTFREGKTTNYSMRNYKRATLSEFYSWCGHKVNNYIFNRFQPMLRPLWAACSIESSSHCAAKVERNGCHHHTFWHPRSLQTHALWWQQMHRWLIECVSPAGGDSQPGSWYGFDSLDPFMREQVETYGKLEDIWDMSTITVCFVKCC